MSGLLIGLIIAHAVICLALVMIVLLQQGKAQGLSGAIAGAGESFFGKSKARTIDAMLKKFTAVVAIAFIGLSIWLYFVIAQNIAANAPIMPDFEITDSDFDFDLDSLDLEPVATGWIVADGVVIDVATGDAVYPALYAADEGLVVDAEGAVVSRYFVDEENGTVLQFSDDWMDLMAGMEFAD